MKTGICVPYVLFTLAALPQMQDAPRGIWPEEFRSSRAPGSAKKATSATPAPKPPPVYVGVTLWRLRPSTSGDRARILVHDAAAKVPLAVEYTPERISMKTRLSGGDKIRLSVEATCEGFLYIFTQEQYADGSLGEPFLIFPSGRILGGRNDVRAGVVLDIPESVNEVPYLTLKRSRPDHVREVLSILVTPRPFLELKASPGMPVPREQFEAMKRKWTAVTQNLELPDTLGSPATPAELDSANRKTLLATTDAIPQSLFRAQSDGRPMLVSIALSLYE